MPRPLYIVCSEDGTEDARTHLVSHFNVLETISMTAIPMPAEEPPRIPIVMPIRIRSTAVWMKLPADPEDREYEFQTVIYTTTEQERVVQHGTFAFSPGTHLFRAVTFGNAMPERPGWIRIESRIRPVGGGDADWLRQDYPIRVEQGPAPEELAPERANQQANPPV